MSAFGRSGTDGPCDIRDRDSENACRRRFDRHSQRIANACLNGIRRGGGIKGGCARHQTSSRI
jgi:hypothetical protein